jgi:hypothetical protein
MQRRLGVQMLWGERRGHGTFGAVSTATDGDSLPCLRRAAPKATPAEIVEKLNKEINAGLADPKMKTRLADLGGTVLPGSPSDFVGMNCGATAGQTIMYCHVHLIPRRAGDVEQPRGGVRAVVPGKAVY